MGDDAANVEAQVFDVGPHVESHRPVMALRHWYRENEALAVLSFAILLTELGFGMVTPVQGLFARDLGASIGFVGGVRPGALRRERTGRSRA
jgi:hypothetical protein